MMSTVLKVHSSGYYKWLKQPISNLEIENHKVILHSEQGSHEVKRNPVR